MTPRSSCIQRWAKWQWGYQPHGSGTSRSVCGSNEPHRCSGSGGTNKQPQPAAAETAQLLATAQRAQRTCSGVSCAILLYAPRSLNDLTGCIHLVGGQA